MQENKEKMVKELVNAILRVVLTPWRKRRRQTEGVAENQLERRLYPNDELLGMVSQRLAEGRKVTINVRGNSMRPFIEMGRDKVQLERIGDPHIGDAVLAEITPGHYVLHRIIELHGDRVTLMGDGNVRGTEHCLRKDLRGIVTHYIRPQRTLPATDPRLQRRIRLWRRMLPIRRYLLLIYRATI